MTTAPSSTPDPTTEAIAEAVTQGRDGDVASARSKLLSLWATMGVTGDPLHRCSLAHYLADLYEDPAEALTWDIRALDAADAVTAQDIAGFYPSLHLNLADNYRRLGSFAAATEHIEAAREHTPALLQDAYGDLIRRAVREVAEAIADRDRAPRPSAPGSPA
ncbi:hypothetical protein DSC45_05055 [Streptomyces sp. YIM 130001]|uniref:hypothetical protein n=1 Tax=Streptomyces sp. YIM 130001 TaxID=2259644 RepID=UPI000E64B1A1|nr:hypothetical protein [Streptomyces sp. YIM 130001]RII20576.1 hypothetical protein DSC45_05055 [Streptomyces sp. YIM 130001]